MIEDLKELKSALMNKTNGFIKGFISSTLMGWEQKYDNEGRPLRYDPNYKDGFVLIDGGYYYFTRTGWHVYVRKEKKSYMTALSDNKNKFILLDIDLRPDYVKNYKK